MIAFALTSARTIDARLPCLACPRGFETLRSVIRERLDGLGMVVGAVVNEETLLLSNNDPLGPGAAEAVLLRTLPGRGGS
jgi:hypothetical protein